MAATRSQLTAKPAANITEMPWANNRLLLRKRNLKPLYYTMKIIDIQPLLVDRYLFVKVVTDEGICGYGESGAWGIPGSLAASDGDLEAIPRRSGPAPH